MNVFFDTSSLFKLYHREADSSLVEKIFTTRKVTAIYLSEIAKVEFASTVWKKVRVHEISELQAKTVVGAFENDFGKFTFVQLNSLIIEQARDLISKYGKHGLRALDSIQLSSAVLLRNHAELYVTADKLLASFFIQEKLPVEGAEA